VATIYSVNLRHAVILDGAYNGRRTSPVGMRSHVTCCSGWRTCSDRTV